LPQPWSLGHRYGMALACPLCPDPRMVGKRLESVDRIRELHISVASGSKTGSAWVNADRIAVFSEDNADHASLAQAALLD
jgi:hypothetical protein